MALLALLAPGLLAGIAALLLAAGGSEAGIFLGALAFVLLLVAAFWALGIVRQAQRMDDA